MTRYLTRMGTTLAAMAVVWLATPATAHADAFTLTSGALSMSRQDAGYFYVGDSTLRLNTQAQLGNFDYERYDPPYFCNSECIGSTINLSMSDSLTRTPVPPRGAIVSALFQLDGTWYSFQTLDYSIVAGNIVAPGDAWASTWFRLSGNATGLADSGATASFQFTGSGTAKSYWDSRNGWLATSYTLEDPAAVPEPASMFLLGTGLVGLAGMRRRKRQALSQQ